MLSTSDKHYTTRWQRVRASLFGDFDEEITSSKHSSMLNLLRPSMNHLKESLINVVEYLSDADQTLRAIPELIELLQDDDRVNTALKASIFLNQLSSKDASRIALSHSAQLISAIVTQLNRHDEPDFIINLLTTLHNISTELKSIQLFYNLNLISVLIPLLTMPIESIIYQTTSLIHAILIQYESIKAQLRQMNAIGIMCNLLGKYNNQKFQAKLLDCLKILAFSCNESKEEIGAFSSELVRIMIVSDYEKLLWTCVRLMKVLSVCGSVKCALIAAGALRVLSAHVIKPLSGRIFVNSLFTLRNLSDCASKEANLEVLVSRLVEVLLGMVDGAVCAVGVLANLTCGNEVYKARFVECGGVEAVLALFGRVGDDAEAVEACVATLRHVTYGNLMAVRAVNVFRDVGGVEIVMQLMERRVRGVVGLVRNLIVSGGEVLGEMRQLGLVQRMVGLLVVEMSAGGDGEVGEILEVMCVLVRDPLCRRVVFEMNFVPVLVQMIFVEDEVVLRMVLAVLNEICGEGEGVELVRALNEVSGRLNEILTVKDEIVASYASALLLRIGYERVGYVEQGMVANDAPWFDSDV